MTNKKIYLERRPEGDYAVRRGGSERASAVEPHSFVVIIASQLTGADNLAAGQERQ